MEDKCLILNKLMMEKMGAYKNNGGYKILL